MCARGGSEQLSEGFHLLMAALKMEEGALSQGLWAPLETGKGEEMDFSCRASRRSAALPAATLILV